ncbi:MAG: serine/threonine-protein kinase [Pseudomonadota bacterium]
MDSSVMQGSPAPMGFRDVSLCGRGATSLVFRATDVRSGKLVALKRLHRQLVQDGEALARLRRELKALDQVEHPGVVRVHDVVRWDGEPTLVMDFIEGEDLKERLVRDGPLAVDEALRIARWLLEVLSNVHARGIVHRDIKPQNIRLDRDRGLHLLDFGSARLDAASQLTTTGSTVGTPEYMAPELFAGSVYDPRVDLYGAGATLYECLCGEPPQVADSLAELARVRQGEDILPVQQRRLDMDAALAGVIDRCLKRAPEDRFASASLALWALKNPEQAAHLGRQRDRRPPCLHCGTAIAASSRRCPSCRRPSPFRYLAGPCHVELETVKDAPGLIAFLVEQAPELGAPTSLLTLSEHCAALSFARQRLLSYVDRAQAVALVRALQRIGANARVVDEPRMTPAITIVLGLLLLMTGVLFLPVLMLYALWRVMRWQDARSALLARTWRRKAVWPSLSSTVWIGVAAVVLFQTLRIGWTSMVGEDASGLSLAWSSVFLSLVGLCTVSSIVRLGRGRLAASPEPEPSQQLRQHLKPWRGASDREPAAPRRTSGVVYAAFVVLFCSLVPIEVLILFRTSERIEGWRATEVSSVLHHNKRTGAGENRRAPPPGQAPDSATGTASRRRTDPAVADSERSDAPGVTSTAAASVSLREAALVVLPPLAALTVLALLLRRRGAMRRDGAAIYAELDLPRLQHLAARQWPHRSSNRTLRASYQQQLESSTRADGFAREAERRAADLLPVLSTASASSLLAALDAVQDAHGTPMARRALLDRCVLDTQPDQAIRLRLLELEGRLEAEAAQALFLRERGSDA